MRSLILPVVLACFLLNGCMTTQPKFELPTTIGGNGLVVGEIYTVGDEISSPYHFNVKINGKVKGKTKDAHFIIALPPGEYNIDSLQGDTYDFTRKQFVNRTYGIDRKFTIHAGEVTNLGQILLVYDPEDLGQQRYFTVAVDNTEDTKYFLKTFYPQLFESIAPDAFRLGLKKYQEGEELVQLRNYIATKIIKNPSYPGNYAVGPAGTIAKIKKNNGKSVGFELISSPTMTGVGHEDGQSQNDRHVFITNDHRMFIIREGEIRQCVIPSAEDLDGVYLVGKKDIILCYKYYELKKYFKLQISNDDGQTWKPNDTLMTEKLSFGSCRLVEDIDGYFIYLTDYPDKMLYAKYGSDDVKKVSLPEEKNNIKRLKLTNSKLFLEKSVFYWTQKTPHPFYIRDREGGEWEERFKPKASCKLLEILDDAGTSLRTVCNREIYRSNDGGISWQLENAN